MSLRGHVAACMRRQNVDSSVLVAVGYGDASRTLEVTFRSGRIYEYFGVPPAMFEELMRAASAGKYFNAEIKPRFSATRAKKRG